MVLLLSKFFICTEFGQAAVHCTCNSQSLYTANEERGKRLEIPEFGGNLGGI
ncbi:MAG: hypothetical protein ACI90V_006848 [Bacillariaceae sp.]|jgi:hypothetical protein